MTRRLLFTLSWVFLAAVSVACRVSDPPVDECRRGETRCEGGAALSCEMVDRCLHEGCWYDAAGHWAWVNTGACGTPREKDPRCEGVTSYCDGLVAVSCAVGFAIERDDGDVRLVADGLVATGPIAYSFRVGDRIPFRLERRSRCGSADVTDQESLVSGSPDVAGVVDGLLIARRPGRANLVAGDDLVAELEVIE